jgi:hypothetical protein
MLPEHPSAGEDIEHHSNGDLKSDGNSPSAEVPKRSHFFRWIIAGCIAGPLTCTVVREVVESSRFEAGIREISTVLDGLEDLQRQGRQPTAQLLEDSAQRIETALKEMPEGEVKERFKERVTRLRQMAVTIRELEHSKFAHPPVDTARREQRFLLQERPSASSIPSEGELQNQIEARLRNAASNVERSMPFEDRLKLVQSRLEAAAKLPDVTKQLAEINACKIQLLDAVDAILQEPRHAIARARVAEMGGLGMISPRHFGSTVILPLTLPRPYNVMIIDERLKQASQMFSAIHVRRLAVEKTNTLEKNSEDKSHLRDR